MRVHELAKEYDISAKDFIEKIQNLGVEVKSHLSGLDQSQVDLIRQHLRSEDSDICIEVDQEIVVPELGEPDSATTDSSSGSITSEGDTPPATDTITINLDDLNLDNITDDVGDTTVQALADNNPIGGGHASPRSSAIFRFVPPGHIALHVMKGAPSWAIPFVSVFKAPLDVA